MAARLSIPTLGTFVSPFVRLVLISPSQPRKTTAAFSRLYAPPSSSLLAGRSHSRRRPSHCHALASSICLSLPIFPHLFLLLPLDPPQPQHPSPHRAALELEVTHGPAASLSLVRALVPLRHSSCSFRTLSLTVYPPCIRLSSPPSSYNLLLSRAAAILPRPKRRHTYARSLSPGPIQQPSFSSSGILCRFRGTEFHSALQCRGSLEKSRDRLWV